MEEQLELEKEIKTLSERPSEAAWLGEIPKQWLLMRFKYLFREKNERSEKGNGDLLSVSQYTGVTKKSDNLEEGDLLTNANSLEGYKKVNKGDLVSNIMLAWNGSLGFSPLDGITSPAYSVYQLVHGDRRYFHYLLRSELYKAEFKRKSTGIIESRLRLYTDDFFRIYSPVPHLQEQTRIATFLDDKTSKIDMAIAQKERLIELLKERKQILIHKAVTRGLNATVKLKDSGVEWIGKVPEGWEVVKLKHVCEFVNDGTHGSYPRVENGYRLLSVRNMIDDRFAFLEDDSRISTRHFMEISSKFEIAEGDVLLAIVGATLGKVAIAERMLEKFVTQRSVATIRLQKKLLPKFLFFYIKSSCFQSYLWLHAGFSAQPGVYLGTLQDAPITFPPIDEQKLIIDELDYIDHKFQNAISKLCSQIQTLKEYKSSLIDGAVRGLYTV